MTTTIQISHKIEIASPSNKFKTYCRKAFGISRFGAELIFSICEAKEVEVVIINKGQEKASFEEDLAKDVLEIITVFSARLYGSRSKKNKKLIDNLSKAVNDNNNSNFSQD